MTSDPQPLSYSRPARGGPKLSRRKLLGGLPDPDASGIEHIVLAMMENRSYDHFLGWVPNSDGVQAGLSYPDRDGTMKATYPLAPDFQGCAYNDPDHTYTGARQQYNGGACDGWLRSGANDIFAIGYYLPADLSFFGQQAANWTVCDRYFSSIMAETFPNRFYQHSGQTDRIHNSSIISTLPTIWDRLAADGLTGGYYYCDVPFLAHWGTKYQSISHSFADFLADAAAGTLPHVSFVDPCVIDEGNGTSADDHPYADVRDGQVFLDKIYRAVTTGPGWAKTILVINYDEWGGFYDHVAPPSRPIPPADRLAGNGDGLLGFRVPCMIFAPWARRGYVDHTLFEHTSILKMIEWRWELEPLTVRDAGANNLALALDFSAPNLAAPQVVVPPGPFGGPCPSGALAVGEDGGHGTGEDWEVLRALATHYGWPRY